jgi:hypothetical protein
MLSSASSATSEICNQRPIVRKKEHSLAPENVKSYLQLGVYVTEQALYLSMFRVDATPS